MDGRRRSLLLLKQADWGEDSPMIENLRRWHYFPQVLEAIETLKVEALYCSPVHGSGHINRVLLLSALIAWREDLEESLLQQYLLVASYHDVGRISDGLDLDHGSRSALQLEALTGIGGERLLEMQGAVAAHSQADGKMTEMVQGFAPKDQARALELAGLLKDADNLDRVRLGDLNRNYLRHESAKELVGFAHRLFQLDQAFKTKNGL